MKNPISTCSTRGLRADRLVCAANRWREQYNPLRYLTLDRAVALLEAYQRGDMADVQWAFHCVEEADPELSALVERRSSALLALDWTIKTCPGADSTLAREQIAALREAYDSIDNFYEALDHLALAAFRGFAHLEKCFDALGRIRHLEILDQWNVAREGIRGPWKYNPEARTAPYRSLDARNILNPDQWIIREVKRPINRIGLIKYARASVAEKDWAAFVEIYGLPGAVIIGPPNVAPEDALRYETQAALVAEGGSGYLPNGAGVQFYSGPRITQPYRDYLRYLSEQLVLAGTGGILTMLTASGTGTLAGSVHAETFHQIARAEARVISEVFQDQFDRYLLDAAFPGRPHLAYFDLDPGEEKNQEAIIDHAVKLSQAGYHIDPAELSERTGFRLAAEPAR
jgi:phage gp29-like protein